MHDDFLQPPYDSPVKNFNGFSLVTSNKRQVDFLDGMEEQDSSNGALDYTKGPNMNPDQNLNPEP